MHNLTLSYGVGTHRLTNTTGPPKRLLCVVMLIASSWNLPLKVSEQPLGGDEVGDGYDGPLAMVADDDVDELFGSVFRCWRRICDSLAYLVYEVGLSCDLLESAPPTPPPIAAATITVTNISMLQKVTRRDPHI